MCVIIFPYGKLLVPSVERKRSAFWHYCIIYIYHRLFRIQRYHQKILPPVQWRHYEHDGVSNQQPHDCLLNKQFIQGADQRKHQSSASLAFEWGIRRWPVNSPHKGSVTRKMLIFDDVIMQSVVRQYHECVQCKVLPGHMQIQHSRDLESHGPLTRYVKLQVAHAPGMPGTFSPTADVKGNR